MRKYLFSAMAVVVALSNVVVVRADDDAKKVIEAAIKAMGGKEKLESLKNKSSIIKGKMKIHTMGMELEATLEGFQGGNHFRQNVELSVMGMDIKQTVGFDGKELWIAVNGKVVITKSSKEDLESLQESIHLETAAGLAFLGDKSVELSIIGDDKIDDKPVVGVRLSKKGRKDVNLFFDKKTNLLVKSEGRALDFQSGQEITSERYTYDYKEVDGMKRPSRLVIKNGDNKVEMDIEKIELVDKHDDSVFKKPSD